MINPQMMGMGQLPNVPTVRELWKDEKSKYRHWMILFGIGIIVIFALLLISVILNSIGAASIKTGIAKNVWENDGPAIAFPGYPYTVPSTIVTTNSFKIAWANIDKVFSYTYIIIPSIKLALIGIGMILYALTIVQSYQVKSFHKLSGWATAVIGVGVLFSVYQLFSLIWSGKTGSFNSPGGIFQFVTYFVIIGVYFSGSIQVTRIRRIFSQSFRIEQLKNSPEYKSAMQQMQGMQNGQMPNGFANGAFGPTMGTPQGNPSNMGPQPTGVQNPILEKSSERIDLELMTVSDLKKVANKLDISGSSSMKKTELIEAILRVTENK